MKTRAKKRKQTLDVHPPDHMAPDVDNCTTASASDKNLAALVWKHFGQEITDTFLEVQKALAVEKRRRRRSQVIEKR